MVMEVIPVKLHDDVKKGDNLAGYLVLACNDLRDGDIVVFTQKIISKQEGQTIDLAKVHPSLLATGIASEYGKDPRIVQLILDQSKRIVRMHGGIIISETIHGFICANAGVDESNVMGGYATLLPDNADRSAEELRRKIKETTGKEIAVLISDTFGRPFRQGQTNVAIGMAGMRGILDYAGKKDDFGRTLRITAIAIADEICSAAELVMGKSLHIPIAIIRNYTHDSFSGSMGEINRPRSMDLFR